MKDDGSDLLSLAQKYQELIESLEQQIGEARRKRTVIAEAIDILRKEGVLAQDKLSQIPPVNVSQEYSKKRNMTDSICDILQAGKMLSAEEIYDELMRHGYKSSSQSLKKDVYTRLYRLRISKVLISMKEGGLKKYRINEQGNKQEDNSLFENVK